jgi:frataxin-like iron-binding protein CyaY|nr:MAG TPA: hypothetical protein [Caudoviricetes sp.]
MEYRDAIDSGFQKYDEIEDEIRRLLKISDSYTQVDYENDILKIEADNGEKNITVSCEITRDEIVEIVVEREVPAKEAICELLKKKVCYYAKDDIR